MDVVRLSRIAEKKNAINPKIHNNLNLLVVLIIDVTTRNPPCKSINSTIVIAPIKKNNMLDISPKISNN